MIVNTIKNLKKRHTAPGSDLYLDLQEQLFRLDILTNLGYHFSTFDDPVENRIVRKLADYVW